MMKIDPPAKLEKALQAHGLVPPQCKLIDIVLAPNHVAIIRYEVFVTHDDIGRLARAFTEAVGDE